MAPVPATGRKRNRKRKRRAASSSSSSSSSDSSSSSAEDVPKSNKPLTSKKAAKESIESSSSSSESDSDSSSDSSVRPTSKPLTTPQQTTVPDQTQQIQFASRRRSPSPPPPAATIPSFIPSTGSAEDDAQKEQILKDRFRKFWMASVADGFKDDLEEIRKEPNLDTSRLSLLIDSLASGADVFTSSSRPGDTQVVNEMEVILEGQ